MAWARTATTNEDFQPLAGVEVECFNVDTLAVISVVESDLGGIALFTALPENQRYFFKVRARRTSTRVESTLDPSRGRTYTGQVRLQILNMSAGITCYDALVDKNKHGAYTTIQAAIDAYSLASPYRSWNISVTPGEYTENLVFVSTRRYALHGCAQTMSSPYGSFGEQEARQESGHTGGVSIIGTITKTGGGQGELSLRGIHINTGVAEWTITISYMVLRLESCFVGSGTTGALVVGVSCGVEAINSQIGNDVAKRSVTLGLAGAFIATGSVFLGWFDGTSQVGVRLDACVVRATRAGAAVIELGALAMTDESAFRILNSYIEQKSATGNGIKLIGTLAALEHGFQILNNYIDGNGGGTGVICESDIDGAIIVGNTFNDWSVGIDAGGAPNVIAWPNLFGANVGTPTTGGGGVGTILTPTHTLLDGTIHTDTLAGVVVDGDVIIGNVTPKWSRLAISIPAANVRNVLGIDNAELRPSWKTALDGTTPADIAAAGSAGTSLVFSHRDHVHKHPVFGSGGLHTEYELVGVAAGLIATHAGLPDVHHAGFIGLTIAGPTNIDPNGGDRITIEDTATVTWASSGAGKIAATAILTGLTHAILSATHSDTLAAAVARGSLIYGNATPKWAALAVGAAGSGLWTDGTDASWTVSPRYAGYLRVGAAAAPTNVTAGDLNAIRLYVGADAAITANCTVDVTGHTMLYGLCKISDTTRFIDPTGAAGHVAGLSLYHTATAITFDFYELQALMDAAPTADSARTYQAVRFLAQTVAGNLRNFSSVLALVGAVGAAQHLGSGTINGMAAINAAQFWGLGAGNVSYAYGLLLQATWSGGSATTVGVLYGIRIDAPVKGASGVLTHYVAEDIQGGITTGGLNIGLRLGAFPTAAIAINTDTAASGVIAWGTARDTNLYRHATGPVLATDSNIRTAGYLRVGTVGSAPTNVTAGDLTAIRGIIGTDEALGASVLLDLNSTTKALLLSRMTTAQKAALTGVAGMVLYDSTLGQFHAYDGAWKQVILVGTPADYTVSNVSADRTYDANATTLDEIADVLGTLVADLTTLGILQ